MPNRILREGILTSERVARLGWPAEVFYRRLMSVVDDFGRYYATPMLLRAACYPLHLDKVSDSDIGKWLAVCAEADLVRVYPAQDGKRYLQMVDFRQQVRAAASKFPQQLGECVADAQQMPSKREASAHLDVFGDVCEDVSGAPAGADGFEEAWKSYPRRPGNSKADALKAWKARAKEGHKPDAMAAGVRRYAAYCAAQQTQSQFIKLAATFFGPGLHFQDEWKAEIAPAPPTETVEAYQARMAREREASLSGVTPMPDSVRDLAKRLRMTA
jgi:hypothetical protein